jgi:protein-S-isoprenylcysteine O-methyltransferase Ste14
MAHFLQAVKGKGARTRAFSTYPALVSRSASGAFLLLPVGRRRRQDAARKAGTLVRYMLLALAWMGYGAVHSAMISETATGFLKRRLGAGFRFYRLAFNLVAIGLLVPVVWYSHSLAGEPLIRWAGPWRAVRYALVALAVLLFVAGGRHYSLRQFAGISGGLASRGGLDSRGVLGVIRHPWYAGVVLLLWARDLDAASLVVSSVLTAYVLVGTLLEERKLVHEFGDAYRDYQRRVSMFVPLQWLRSRL